MQADTNMIRSKISGSRKLGMMRPSAKALTLRNTSPELVPVVPVVSALQESQLGGSVQITSCIDHETLASSIVAKTDARLSCAAGFEAAAEADTEADAEVRRLEAEMGMQMIDNADGFDNEDEEKSELRPLPKLSFGGMIRDIHAALGSTASVGVSDAGQTDQDYKQR